MSPSLFNALDFKIPVNPELLNEMEALYVPPDHAVFELVLPAFHEHVSQLYVVIGQPEVMLTPFGTFISIFSDGFMRDMRGS